MRNGATSEKVLIYKLDAAVSITKSFFVEFYNFYFVNDASLYLYQIKCWMPALPCSCENARSLPTKLQKAVNLCVASDFPTQILGIVTPTRQNMTKDNP